MRWLTVPLTFISTLILLLPLFVSALPTEHGDLAKRQSSSTREATAKEVKELTFYTSLSSAAYCKSVIPGGKLTCSTCDKANGLEMVKAFTTRIYDTNVFVARGDSEKTIYVSFRGSASGQNWYADFNGSPVSYGNGVSGAMVHMGFQQSYKEVQKDLTQVVQQELKSHSNYTVAITGHSLGGATAVLCALDLYQQGVKDIKLFTQGQPRVGNKKFAEYIMQSGIPYKRAVHASDPVPQTPSPALGFAHAGEEYWDRTTKIVVCPDSIEPKGCSESYGAGMMFTDHLSYFGVNIGVCMF